MRDRRVWAVAVATLAAIVVLVIVRLVTADDSPGDGVAGPAATTKTGGTSAAASPTATPTATADPSGAASPSASPEPSSTDASAPPTPSSGARAPDGEPWVTILRPEAGESVQLPLALSGTAVAPDGILRFEVRRGGRVIANGPAYADAASPARGSWQVEVELPLGSYTAVAWVETSAGKRLGKASVRFSAG